MSAREDLRAAVNGAAPVVTLPAPSAPMKVAREITGAKHTHPSGALTLRHWRGGWWRWKTTRWIEVEQREMTASVYAFTEHAVYVNGGGERVPWAPSSHKVSDVLDALAAIVHLPETVEQPSWPNGGADGVLVSCTNGLLDVAGRRLLAHDPGFFNSTGVPFDFDPDAPAPERWTAFLTELWGDDATSIEALQEWFGYVLSGRLDQHKILLLVGPTRAGKGVIARTLGALVGKDNVAGPTLSSLKTDFGLAPLVGKSLAVVSDARLNGGGAPAIVERLLSVSGEDTLAVNRKYREAWNGKLSSRLMVCSNELPQLGDASAAIAGRMIALQLSRSWLGAEDHGLELALLDELPGILNWALDGLTRLDRVGRFSRPRSTDEAMITLQDLASPVSAFIRDRCVLAGDSQVTVDKLYGAWREWAEDNGNAKSTKQVFGRDLRAAQPAVRVMRARTDDDSRERVYTGIELRGSS